MNINKAVKRLLAKNRFSLSQLWKLQDRDYYAAMAATSFQHYKKRIKRSIIYYKTYSILLDRKRRNLEIPSYSFNIKGTLSSRMSRTVEQEFVDKYDDICGFCGLPGADKIPHPVRWPGEESAGTLYVHAECEDEECKRAHSELSDKQREEFLRTL